MAKRILVIDDDRDFAEMVADTLGELGFESQTVCQSCTLNDVLDKIDDFHPDLITLDILMPGADGFSILDELLSDRHTKQLPVILITGWYDNISTEHLPANVRDVFGKPMDLRKFSQEVSTFLEAA